MLVLALALLAITIIACLPVQSHLALRQRGWEIVLDVEARLAWLRVQRTVPISEHIATAVEHMWKRWRAKGEPVKIPLQKTIRRFPEERVLRAVRPPIRYFRDRLHFRQLDVHWEIGGFDAMQSALLAGHSWACTGIVLSQVSRLFNHLEPGLPRVEIVPVFAGPAFRLDIDCIVRNRLGNIIVVGVWLLTRLARDGEIRAWARDSWRRKGVEGNGRTSDPGPDEDGHGEPQGHG